MIFGTFGPLRHSNPDCSLDGHRGKKWTGNLSVPRPGIYCNRLEADSQRELPEPALVVVPAFGEAIQTALETGN